MSKADDELIADCLNGQTHAFGTLVVRYQNRLFNSLSRVLGSVEDARDVSQETFVHAFQKLHTFRGEAAFYSWLYRIALNTAVTLYRQKPVRAASIDAARERAGLEPTDHRPSSQPEHSLETLERQQLVRTALAALTEEFRTVLILKEVENLKYEEIADIMGCPIGTVRSRIHRARLELRDKLDILMRQQER